MANFLATDRTSLTYHALGDGPPLICLPGGPMRASAYLGDLVGLSAHRRLLRLDLRGTGDSAVPEDTATYRCDRQVDDIEALRVHLGLGRIDLLAHCAGANLAVAYVSRYPERVGRLVLVTPSPHRCRDLGRRQGPARGRAGAGRRDVVRGGVRGVGGDRGGAGGGRALGGHRAVLPWALGLCRPRAARRRLRAEEPGSRWRLLGGRGLRPRWQSGGPRPLRAPVLVLAGEVDLNSPPRAMAEYAELFPDARLIVQGGASHHPWMDDAGRFTATVAEFLA